MGATGCQGIIPRCISLLDERDLDIIVVFWPGASTVRLQHPVIESK